MFAVAAAGTQCGDANGCDADTEALIQTKTRVEKLMRGDDMVDMTQNGLIHQRLAPSGVVQLPLPNFTMISSGTCADVGMRPITERDECASAFQLVSCEQLSACGSLNVGSQSNRNKPIGCYYKSPDKLKLNADMNWANQPGPSERYRVLCASHEVNKVQVPTCAEELLVRHKASRMLSTQKSHANRRRYLWTNIGASFRSNSDSPGWPTGAWNKEGQPIVLGPALVRMVFHDFVDHNNLQGTTAGGGFDACMHAPQRNTSDQSGFDPDIVDLDNNHNSGLEEALSMVRILVKYTSMSVPDGTLLATAAFLEGMAGLNTKVNVRFGRPDGDCDGGNQFQSGSSGQIYLSATPSKFDEPQRNIDFFTALGFTKREMVALYGAHTLGGLNSGVIPYGSMGGAREAPFCDDPAQGGTAINQTLKDATFYSPGTNGISRDSTFFDVWFDRTPGTFDEHYFKQMLDEYDLYPDNYEIGEVWTRRGEMNESWVGAHGIAWDLNRNDEVGHREYPSPAFPHCGQARGTLLGEASRACIDEGISQTTMDTIPFSCPHWSSACDAGRWCRHIPLVNPPNQANIKSLTQWAEYGDRKGRVVTLPSDWALLMDSETLQHVREFSDASAPEVFHQAFAEVLEKMVDTGYTDLQVCSPVDCNINGQAFSCSGVELNSCDSLPEGTGCRLVGAFGFEGEVSCNVSGNERLFRCALHESDRWNAFFQ
jgi:hypothetical protein